MKCDCCKKVEVNEVYVLPFIGYGSWFDCMTEEDRTKFRLCPDCAKKVNRWIHKKAPTISLDEFWKCNIVQVPFTSNPNVYMEEFQYEELLWEVFRKFMPTVLYGEHYRIPKFLSFFGK